MSAPCLSVRLHFNQALLVETVVLQKFLSTHRHAADAHISLSYSGGGSCTPLMLAVELLIRIEGRPAVLTRCHECH